MAEFKLIGKRLVVEPAEADLETQARVAREYAQLISGIYLMADCRGNQSKRELLRTLMAAVDAPDYVNESSWDSVFDILEHPDHIEAENIVIQILLPNKVSLRNTAARNLRLHTDSPWIGYGYKRNVTFVVDY